MKKKVSEDKNLKKINSNLRIQLMCKELKLDEEKVRKEIKQIGNEYGINESKLEVDLEKVLFQKVLKKELMKEKPENNMEKIMKLWAKISSIVIIALAIYLIHLMISAVELSMDSQFISIKSVTTSIVISVLFSIASMIIFYFPLFYFGWVKEPKNESIKSWAKILTIFITIAIIYLFIIYFGGNFPESIFLIFWYVSVMPPLFYYGWSNCL